MEGVQWRGCPLAYNSSLHLLVAFRMQDIILSTLHALFDCIDPTIHVLNNFFQVINQNVAEMVVAISVINF